MKNQDLSTRYLRRNPVSSLAWVKF